MAKIPADMELRLARAHKMMADRMRHLNQIIARFKVRYRDLAPLDHIEIIPGDDKQYGAVIFFRMETEVAECENNGTSQSMRNFIYDEFEKFGKGDRSELDIQFEFDSFENVTKNFEGSYFLRMR